MSDKYGDYDSARERDMEIEVESKLCPFCIECDPDCERDSDPDD